MERHVQRLLGRFKNSQPSASHGRRWNCTPARADVVVPLAQPQALTRESIGAAIKWGESGDVRPYPLHHAQATDTTNSVVVGAIYTPFVRVALAAARSRENGGMLTAEEVSPALLDPIVYIAFRWYCGDANRGEKPR